MQKKPHKVYKQLLSEFKEEMRHVGVKHPMFVISMRGFDQNFIITHNAATEYMQDIIMKAKISTYLTLYPYN